MDEEEAISPVVGTILLVAIAFVLAGTVFLVMQTHTEAVEEPPRIAFRQDPAGEGATLTVASVSGLRGVVDWSNVEMAPSSTAACTLPTGTLHAGDVVTCTTEGALTLSYRLPSGDSVLLFDGLVR